MERLKIENDTLRKECAILKDKLTEAEKKMVDQTDINASLKKEPEAMQEAKVGQKNGAQVTLSTSSKCTISVDTHVIDQFIKLIIFW